MCFAKVYERRLLQGARIPKTTTKCLILELQWRAAGTEATTFDKMSVTPNHIALDVTTARHRQQSLALGRTKGSSTADPDGLVESQVKARTGRRESMCRGHETGCWWEKPCEKVMDSVDCAQVRVLTH